MPLGQSNTGESNSQVSNMAGNATGQCQGASAVQTQEPQVFRPKLIQSSVSSGNLEARRTVSDAISQQSSNQARMNALKDSTWRNTMSNVLNTVSKAYRSSSVEEKTPSRSSSAGTSGSSDQASRN